MNELRKHHDLMSFKVHLLIVSLIIAAVMLFWQLKPNEKQVVKDVNGNEITRRIIVTHATWGQNCLQYLSENTNRVTSLRTADLLKEAFKLDNVFKEVSLACNGKLECELDAGKPFMSEDPQPECTPKSLEVEYRCFSFDRPWRLKTVGGAIMLDCNNNANTKP